MAEAPPTEKIRFIDSMPKPLLIVFLVFAVSGIGLVVWLIASPPSPPDRALELRRSAPTGDLSHDVLRARLVDVPTPLPTPLTRLSSCSLEPGIVIEGGTPAVERLATSTKQQTPLPALCRLGNPAAGAPLELREAVRGLNGARIRFALFSRTGELSTVDMRERRILLAVALSRTNVHPMTIAPLLAHEGYHLAQGTPITASQEFGARVAELAACRLLIIVDNPREDWPRGCVEADDIVRLGRERAVELLVRAGFSQ